MIPLLLEKEGIIAYSNSLSAQQVNYWLNVEVINLKELTYSNLLSKLRSFKRVEKVSEHNEFSIKGDIVSLWPFGYSHPIRIEYFGEEFERAYFFDELYGRQIKDANAILISSAELTEVFDQRQIFVLDKPLQEEVNFAVFTQHIQPNINQLFGNAIEIIETDYSFPQLFFNRTDLLEKELARYKDLGYTIAIFSKNATTLPTSLRKYALAQHTINWDYSELILKRLPAGFESVEKKELYLTDREVFGTIHLDQKVSAQSDKTTRILKQLESDINIGDYIVHEDYGVGIYRGIVQEKSGDALEDYLLLEYDKEDQLFVPISQVAKLTKFISDGTTPKLTRLGKKEWDNLKKKVKNSIGILARELVEHYAHRRVAKAPKISPDDSEDYNNFIKTFPYELTDDQSRTINEVLDDMTRTTPMDRLIVGDVGFGKTEVVIRAAFKMCEEGHQIAILCPTTVLAAQHYSVFKNRFKETPFTVESISRFNTPKANKEIVDKLNEGKVDIIIGTHRLLSGDVKFKSLGLLVVDEEQKFGVGQKEKIKKLNYGVHQLAVTATPIPRTLSMALSTIQEISIISTPPKSRKSIKTELLKNDWNTVAKAIEFEVNRGGQVYFVHNSVQTIQSIVARLQKLVPHIPIIFAHGQMPTKELESIMTDFYDGKYKILVATTIIENGLDMPNVNTMIINQAHRFGLAQLYQLRGRVGRSDKQAYCYLFYEGREVKDPTLELSPDEEKLTPKQYLERLQAILDASDLGSGFKIASKDLEIRGAGNLLGHQQSGNINTIGYSLYMQLLSQEIEKIESGVERGGIISF